MTMLTKMLMSTTTHQTWYPVKSFGFSPLGVGRFAPSTFLRRQDMSKMLQGEAAFRCTIILICNCEG